MAYIRTPTPVQVRGRTMNRPVPGGMPVPVGRPRIVLEGDPVPSARVRVRAKNEMLAKALNYVLGNSGRGLFDGNGVAEWPRDQFTQRRLKDGDVTLVEAQGEKKENKENKEAPKRAQYRAHPE
jgi:hypothetical protein